MIRTFLTGVECTSWITHRILSVTVSGGLQEFKALGPDQFVYVLAPPRGRRELTVDASFSWDQVERMPVSDRPIGAYYTVRRWRPSAGSIELWIVVHGDEGDGSWWAQQVRPGEPVALWGPRSLYCRPDGTDDHVLIGDETATPAIAAILESLAAGERARVFCLGGDERDRVRLDSRADVQVNWFWRRGGEGVRELAAAVRELALSPTTYVWGAGERHEMVALRAFFRRERTLAADRVSMTSYWRRH